MNLRSTLSRGRTVLIGGVALVAVVSLAAGFTAGTVAAAVGNHATPSLVASAAKNAGTQEAVPGTALSGTVTAGGTSTATIYQVPGYGGSLGVAPENTIVAAGTGIADMKADGSDRAAALAKATSAALADAKSQAQAVATSMGVSLKGVYSVTTSSGDNYAYPQGCSLPVLTTCGSTTSCSGSGSGSVDGNPGTGDVPVTTVPGAAGPATTAPEIAPVPSPPGCEYAKAAVPSTSQLVVTVVVAYRFG